MARFSLKIASLAIGASLCLPGALAQRGGVRKPPKKQPKQQQSAPALPAYTPAPLQPLPLDQVPAVAPKVSYADGELSIEAHNSTLADVLKSVREKTGAELEIPANASERVVADIGPGRARDVLTELLNGTHFNYVIVGSSADPAAVQSIFLTPKSGGPDAPSATAFNRPGGPQRTFPAQPAVTTPPADAADESADEADVPDDQPATAADQNDQKDQNPGQQTPKTPEQLLQELQRQQQQMQQQQNPQNGQPPKDILPNQPPTAAPPNSNKPD